MNLARHYSEPPITEAILDIRVEPLDGISLESLASCQDSVRSDYPTKREIKKAIAHIEIDSLSASASSKDIGYAFVQSEPDAKQVFQARTNGFTANRLAPYPGWITFSREARRLWDIYCDVAKPKRVTRIALRYVNRFDIPHSPVELKDYFRTAPEISLDLPQSLDTFFMRVRLPLPDAKINVNIVQTIVEPRYEGGVSVILDLDLFRVEAIPTDEDDLWSLVELLRNKKNVVFEACITDKSRELLHQCQQ